LWYGIGKGLVTMVAKPMFKLKTTGSENIPPGSVLLASNHVSHLDPPLIAISIRRQIRHMAKKELFSNGFLRWYMTTIGTILVDRGNGKQALADAVAALREGSAVCIFPEGTRSKDGVLSRGRAGAVVIAIQADCPILPMAIIGSERAMTKGSSKIKAVPVSLAFGSPYKIDYAGDRENIPRDVIERETLELMARIEVLLPAHMRPSIETKRMWQERAAAYSA
jgi:1-acyl-sn-glycerol-3-phosphate acyltransferase